MFHRTVVATILSLACLAAHAELPQPMSERLALANISQDAVGSIVLRLSDGATLVSHNADMIFQPGSTMKLVSSVAGLDRLGPLFRGRTMLQSNADIRDATLQGDLVLRGGADADLNWEALQSMLQTLRHKGIRHIRGDLVIDRSLYQPARLDIGQPAFDEAPEFRYNVIPDALGLNLNLLNLDLAADQNTLRINMMPVLDRVSITHDMTLVDAPCKDWDKGWLPPTVEKKRGKIRVILHGTYPRDCAKTTELNVLDRTDFTERLFVSLWKQLGGTFKGQVREASPVADLRVLAEHRSRPLAEILRDINKASDNTFARLLYLNMGTYSVDGAMTGNTKLLEAEPAGTLLRSDREVRRWFRANGIDDSGLVLENGSGLSRNERIKPVQLASVLRVAYNSNWAPEFMASLPLGGMDGTMRSRLKGGPAEGRARIKTGSLRNVVAVAGFVLDAQGRQCIVVGMINSETMKLSEGRAALDAMITWVAQSAGT